MWREIKVLFDLVEMVGICGIEASVTWDESYDNSISSWLDEGRGAGLGGEEIVFVVVQAEGVC